MGGLDARFPDEETWEKNGGDDEGGNGTGRGPAI